jgi:hypothetical protein
MSLKTATISAVCIAGTAFAASRTDLGDVWVQAYSTPDVEAGTVEIVIEGEPARALYERLLAIQPAPGVVTPDETVLSTSTMRCGRRQRAGQAVEHRCKIVVDDQGEIDGGDGTSVTALIGVW